MAAARDLREVALGRLAECDIKRFDVLVSRTKGLYAGQFQPRARAAIDAQMQVARQGRSVRAPEHPLGEAQPCAFTHPDAHRGVADACCSQP